MTLLSYREPSSEPTDAVPRAGASGPRAPERSLFIVGAPRCGTTALSKLLARHPQLCFAKPKETHYFLLGSGPGDARDDRARFVERHFPTLGPQHLMIAEGSVSYLYAPEALLRLCRALPEARFVVGLRNPVDLVRSYHDRMVYMTEEDEPDLARAWDLQEDRARGRHLPRGCRSPSLLAYREVGRLGTHLERLLAIAGRDRVFAYLLDELEDDPGELYARLLRFAGLPHDGRRHFTARAAGPRRYRWRWMQALAVGKLGLPLPAVIDQYQGNGRWIRPLLRPVKRRLKKWNTRRAAGRPPLTPELHARLRRRVRSRGRPSRDAPRARPVGLAPGAAARPAGTCLRGAGSRRNPADGGWRMELAGKVALVTGAGLGHRQGGGAAGPAGRRVSGSSAIPARRSGARPARSRRRGPALPLVADIAEPAGDGAGPSTS